MLNTNHFLAGLMIVSMSQVSIAAPLAAAVAGEGSEVFMASEVPTRDSARASTAVATTAIALMPEAVQSPMSGAAGSNVQIQLMLKPEELLSKKKSVLGGAALSLLPGAGLVYAEKPLAGALVAGLFAGGVGCMMMGMGSSEFSTTYLADFTVVGYVDTVGGTAFQVCGGAILSSFLVSVLTTVPTIRLHNRKVEALRQLYQTGAPPVTLRLNGAGLEGRF